MIRRKGQRNLCGLPEKKILSGEDQVKLLVEVAFVRVGKNKHLDQRHWDMHPRLGGRKPLEEKAGEERKDWRIRSGRLCLLLCRHGRLVAAGKEAG